jgi:hypothetical protein
MVYEVGPYDSRHFYVQWGGKLPGGETWSCGFRMLNPAEHKVTDGPQLLVGISAAISTFHSEIKSNISPRAKLSFVKVNSIELDGTYTLDTTQEATYADKAGSGSDALTPPNQVAWAVSLLTGYSRGPAHAGRFYLPLPALAIQSTGTVTALACTDLKTVLATLRTACNAAVPGYVMAVMSRKKDNPGHRAVTGFEVGTVLDTQRRRRRSVAENYQ